VFRKLTRKLFHRARARIVIVSVDTDRGVETIIRKKGDYSDIGVMLVLAMELDATFVDTVRAALMTFDDPEKEKIEFLK
jgi:hypothetical protein